jgi:hypothetical protein
VRELDGIAHYSTSKIEIFVKPVEYRFEISHPY